VHEPSLANSRNTGRTPASNVHQPPDEMEPYERLLGDAAKGEATLFAREDAVLASWRIVDPVLGNTTPLFEYEPNTWGPAELDRTLMPEGGWHSPEP
jgi:glucose-6-phosphate 1-dehydrogenase